MACNDNDAMNVSSDDSVPDTGDNFMARITKAENMSLLNRFMCICTAHKVMVLGDHWGVFGKFVLNIGSASKTQMSTWLPKHYVSFFMVGLPNDAVAFYIHGTQQMFSVSCSITTPKISEGTILCLNYTEDAVTDCDGHVTKSPRLLLFDIVSLKGVRVQEDASARYSLLMDMYETLFKPIPAVAKLFTLQWVGHNTHAQAFVDGAVDVRHPVGGIMALTGNPLRPIRTIRIKLPMIVFDQKHFMQLQKTVPPERIISCSNKVAAKVVAKKVEVLGPQALIVPVSAERIPVKEVPIHEETVAETAVAEAMLAETAVAEAVVAEAAVAEAAVAVVEVGVLEEPALEVLTVEVVAKEVLSGDKSCPINVELYVALPKVKSRKRPAQAQLQRTIPMWFKPRQA
jgi:hypothetical protein